jgi:hypothetical protein
MSNLRVPASRSSAEPTKSPSSASSRATGRRAELTPFRALLDGRPKHPHPETPGIERPSPASPGTGLLTHREGPDRRPSRERAVDHPEHERRGETPSPPDTFTSTPSSLEPFRVNAALLPPQGNAPLLPRDNDAAFALASELIESMRVGRFGRDGHAVSMRLRAGRGTVGVELREESGSLRLRLEGASASELEGLGERVRSELLARGLVLEELELA